jgi:ornithine cyclodeaminase/alanine dehydrogenase-like protein (mu-crystallin family)
VSTASATPPAGGGSPRGAKDLLYLSRDDVQRASDAVDLVAEVREVLRLHGSGQTRLPDEAYLQWTTQRGELARSLNMPGHAGGSFEVVGTKIINSNPGNPEDGVPRASGLTLLFDDLSAQIVCVMEGAYISSMRTAAVTAVAAELLGPPVITSLALLGSGVLARAHIEVLAPRLPRLAVIRVYDMVHDRAVALAAWVAELGAGVRVDVARTPEEAVRASQLVVAVTTTTTAYIPRRWLAPGTLVVNVSLDDVAEDVVLGSDCVIVDDWNLVKNDERRLLGRMYRAGTLRGPADDGPLPAGTARVRAELGDLLCGRTPGRTRADEVILVNPFGMAIEDLAIAARVYEQALKRGLGTVLPR